MERTELEKKYIKRIVIRVSLYFLRRKASKMKSYQKANNHKWRNGSWDKYIAIKNKIEHLRLKLESQDYIEFYEAKESIFQHRSKLETENRIPQCTPRPLGRYNEKSILEQNNYLLLEIFEGKHNNFFSF